MAGNTINLTLQIEIAGDGDQRSRNEWLAGVRQVDVEKGLASAENKEVLHLPEHTHERHGKESIAKLEEQLWLAESGCSRLQAQIMEEYVPNGISTWPPHQIQWDAPSPIQSDNDDEFEDITGEEIL
ncbi:hypothetical protein BDR06DRAFT_1012232 [Suillus hirtellus]|nr:hypothetical protein BDR06DRAFT_1012232 [Suillus hirtellus]